MPNEHAAEAVAQEHPGRGVIRMIGQARIADPRDPALLQPLGEGQRVVDVTLYAKRQGLQTEQEQE